MSELPGPARIRAGFQCFQPALRIGVIRLDLEQRAEVSRGLLRVARHRIGKRAVPISIGILRIDRDRLGVIRDRFLVFFQVSIGERAPLVGAAVVWDSLDHHSVIRNRLLPFTFRDENKPAKAPGVGIIRARFAAPCQNPPAPGPVASAPGALRRDRCRPRHSAERARSLWRNPPTLHLVCWRRDKPSRD